MVAESKYTNAPVPVADLGAGQGLAVLDILMNSGYRLGQKPQADYCALHRCGGDRECG